MAKCPKCAQRKGKRYCPALATEICSKCCADGRLKTISCPQDCPYLESELYQHKRRREKAMSRGKDLVESNAKLYASNEARNFAFNLEADIYYFQRENGPLEDSALIEVLQALESSHSRVVVPQASAHPLSAFLLERFEDSRRYPLSANFDQKERARALRTLAGHVRSLAGEGTQRFAQRLSEFFDALDFEADLDYSPKDPRERGAEPEKRSPGGLILPP